MIEESICGKKFISYKNALSHKIFTQLQMTGQLVRILALAGAIVAAQAACPHEGINKFWSDMNLSGDVEITEPVVLDTETGDLNTVVVKGEGSIIFSPDVDMAKLTSSRITVQDGGSVIIGSDDCRFDGNAEIELTGNKINS